MLVSAIQHESAISIDISPPSWTALPPSFHPTSLGYNSWAPCAIYISCPLVPSSVSNFEGGIIFKDNPLSHHSMYQHCCRPVKIQSKGPSGGTVEIWPAAPSLACFQTFVPTHLGLCPPPPPHLLHGCLEFPLIPGTSLLWFSEGFAYGWSEKQERKKNDSILSNFTIPSFLVIQGKFQWSRTTSILTCTSASKGYIHGHCQSSLCRFHLVQEERQSKGGDSHRPILRSNQQRERRVRRKVPSIAEATRHSQAMV